MRELPNKFLAAMIAVRPLPGSPGYEGDDEAIIAEAVSDLEHYVAAGVDAVVLENSHDLPYVRPPVPDTAFSLMETVSREVRRRYDGPVGIQMLEAANDEALAIANSADLDFVRVESYVFAHVGGAGLIEGCAGRILRERKRLGCQHIRVFGDIKKKHCSHALTGDLDIVDELKQAEFFKVDGVVVTGPRTGEPPDHGDLERLTRVASVPVLIGSGMTPENVASYVPLVDGFIVGSTFRRGGEFLAELVPARLNEFVEVFRRAVEEGPND